MVTWIEASPEEILCAEEEAIVHEETDIALRHVKYFNKVLNIVHDSVVGKLSEKS